MSIKQEEFVARLVADRFRSLGAESPTAAMAQLAPQLATMDNRQMSQLIDRLMEMPNDPVEGQPERLAGFRRVGVNDSAGTCDACGHIVESRTGFFFGPREQGARWSVCHAEGQCSTEDAPVQADLSEGMWTGSDGSTIMIYLTNNSRLGAKVWTGTRFEYTKGATTIARSGHKMTAAEAASFGHSTGKCVFCRQKLTDGRSTSVGYGPTCAENNGLPWGELVVTS
jgi:hypothetical protein